MKINKSFPYQEENSDVAVNSKILIGLIITSLLILIFSRQIIVVLFIVFFIILEIFNLKTTHGIVTIELENNDFQFKVKGGQNNFVKRISSHQFSWNYVHLETFSAGGDGVSNGSGHTNFIQLKLEMIDTNDQKNVIIQELYPWQEIPKNWNYKILDDTYNQRFRVKNGLVNLKKEMTYT